MAKNTINRRHTRRSKYSRLRKAQNGKGAMGDWLSRQNTNLAATGDVVAFTVTLAVKADNFLALSGNPADGEGFSIINPQGNSQAYVFKTALVSGGQPNEILIGGSADASKDNAIAAINAGAGEGTTYGTATEANKDVLASDGGLDQVDVDALLFGAEPNAVLCSDDNSNMAWNTATLANGVDSTIDTIPAHGFSVDDGPINLDNSGGALPAGLLASTNYFITSIPTANSYKVSLARGGEEVQATDAGTGTHSYNRCDDDNECIHDLLKSNTSQRIVAATDIDDLD